jgi:hypothetical protein
MSATDKQQERFSATLHPGLYSKNFQSKEEMEKFAEEKGYVIWYPVHLVCDVP